MYRESYKFRNSEFTFLEKTIHKLDFGSELKLTGNFKLS